MIVIREPMGANRDEGLTVPLSARVFQDLVLDAIANGPYSESITVKGGVLIREINRWIKNTLQTGTPA